MTILKSKWGPSGRNSDIGKALNKILCNTWLREIGEGHDDNQGAKAK